MGLSFGTNTTDLVAVTHSASTDNLTAISFLMWLKTDTITVNKAFWSKMPGGVFNAYSRFANLSTGDLTITHRRTGGAFTYQTNNTPMSSTGVWYCLAVTYDMSLSSSTAHMYVGTLTTHLTEATYSVTTDGSGTCDQDDSGTNTWIGNQSDSPSKAYQGTIASFMQWNRALSLAELQTQQYLQAKTSGCIIHMPLGFAGAVSTQPDWSGSVNTGSLSGPTQTVHVPLGLPFFM